MLSIQRHAEHRQQQTLSPRLQRAVWLLQLSSTDFAHEVQSVMGRNPFLEGEEGEGGDPDPASKEPGLDASHDAGDMPATDRGADLTVSADGFDATADDFTDGAPAMPASESAEHDGAEASSMDGAEAYLDAVSNDAWSGDGLTRLRRAEDGEISALDLMAAEPTLTAELHAQLDLLSLPERDAALARAIVESLDDDGYLRTELEELIDLTDLSPPATPQELKIALCRVQSLEPAGVAARNVAECLTLQLQGIECEKTRALARAIVNDHMESLARHDVAKLARVLHESPEQIEAVCERIRRLDPRPGWRCGPAQVQYVVPDVIVRKVRGRWTVQLNGAVVPRVRMNRVYAELFQRHRRAEDQALADHLKEARWTLRNVEQRFATIVQVAEAIVARQHRFLEHGQMAMRPMGLREIADELGLHESTVSRVTNNKFMMTPLGVFELKYFFSRALTTESGKTCSGTALRSLIKDMIEAESPDAPLSDADIAKQLARQGVRLARRTVTKYRQLLRIDPIERRRGRA
ncbi:RNA polymerase factor sigma-54 [Ideonella sp. DXS29W]|uniref:RNA polymerase sigma-54 factor n=1 Tax=Ideonella lacteola TaxID=2984193 RepID=A0ABU9BLT3_9BURK